MLKSTPLYLSEFNTAISTYYIKHSPSLLTPPDFSVEEMQAYLNEYQPRHYSRDGRQPLLYAAVLLLSLQFHAAAAFLVHDPGSVGATHGADAAHLCAAMQMDGLLDAAPPLPRVGPPGSRRADAAAVVRAYAGQQFLARQQGAGHVEAALEYFVAGEGSPDWGMHGWG